MKYAIVSKKNKDSENVKKMLMDKLIELGYEYDDENPNIIFSIGGDGTFLRSVKFYLDKNPIFVGINTGNLGFLCEFNKNNIDDIFYKIDEKNIKEIKLIECSYNNLTVYGLNEVRVESLNGTSTLFEVYFNNQYFESVKADGLCVCSSHGSSGINRSMGGALIDTNLDVLEFKEKLPINSKKYKALNSSVVFNGDTNIKIKVNDRYALGVAYDSTFNIDKINTEITIKLSNKTIKVLSNNVSYLTKIKESFL